MAQREAKDLSKVTKRHFRRTICNEYCTIREQQNMSGTQDTSCRTIKNTSIASDSKSSDNNIDNCYDNADNCYDIDFRRHTLPVESKCSSAVKEIFQSQKKITLANKIAHWIIVNNISHNVANELLSIMRSENLHVPKDCRTLLKTPSYCNTIVDIPLGAYIHFGIKEGILYTLNQNILKQNVNILSLTINIDGLPISKSSSSQFWSILMSIDLMEVSDPFIVGIYHGMRKPISVKKFLEAFVKEYLVLKKMVF